MKTAAAACLLVALPFGLCSCDGPSSSPGPADAADASSASDDAASTADTMSTADVWCDGSPEGDAYCPVVDFWGCGGDVLGTWRFRSLCPDDPIAAAAVCEHPFDNMTACTGPGNEAICDGSVRGTLTFHADETVDIAVEVELVSTWNYSDECLQAAITTGGTTEERCMSMDGLGGGLACSYQVSCTCVRDPLRQTDLTKASYHFAGQELVIGNDPPATYCVDGDRLTMDFYSVHPASWRYWVLERD